MIPRLTRIFLCPKNRVIQGVPNKILFTGFTEEEREFSHNAILRQQQANHTDTHEDMIDEEDEEDLDDTGHGTKRN